MAAVIARRRAVDFYRSAHVAFHQFLAIRGRSHLFNCLVSMFPAVLITLAWKITQPLALGKSAVRFRFISFATWFALVIHADSIILFQRHFLKQFYC